MWSWETERQKKLHGISSVFLLMSMSVKWVLSVIWVASDSCVSSWQTSRSRLCCVLLRSTWWRVNGVTTPRPCSQATNQVWAAHCLLQLSILRKIMTRPLWTMYCHLESPVSLTRTNLNWHRLTNKRCRLWWKILHQVMPVLSIRISPKTCVSTNTCRCSCMLTRCRVTISCRTTRWVCSFVWVATTRATTMNMKFRLSWHRKAITTPTPRRDVRLSGQQRICWISTLMYLPLSNMHVTRQRQVEQPTIPNCTTNMTQTTQITKSAWWVIHRWARWRRWWSVCETTVEAQDQWKCGWMSCVCRTIIMMVVLLLKVTWVYSSQIWEVSMWQAIWRQPDMAVWKKVCRHVVMITSMNGTSQPTSILVDCSLRNGRWRFRCIIHILIRRYRRNTIRSIPICYWKMHSMSVRRKQSATLWVTSRNRLSRTRTSRWATGSRDIQVGFLCHSTHRTLHSAIHIASVTRRDRPLCMRTMRTGNSTWITAILRNIRLGNRSRTWKESRSGWISSRHRTWITCHRAFRSIPISHVAITNSRNVILIMVCNCQSSSLNSSSGTASSLCVGISSSHCHCNTPLLRMQRLKNPIPSSIRICIQMLMMHGKTLWKPVLHTSDVRWHIRLRSMALTKCLWTRFLSWIGWQSMEAMQATTDGIVEQSWKTEHR